MHCNGYRLKGLSLRAHLWLAEVRRDGGIRRFGGGSTRQLPFGFVTEDVPIMGFGTVPMKRYLIGSLWCIEVLQEINGPPEHPPLVFTALRWKEDCGAEEGTLWTYDDITRARRNYQQDLLLQAAERSGARRVFG